MRKDEAENEAAGCGTFLLWIVVLYLLARACSGCGVAPTTDLLEPCGTHPERPGNAIYCVCIRECPGQHQCTVHTGPCDPNKRPLDCPEVTGYSENSGDMWELAQTRPCPQESGTEQ